MPEKLYSQYITYYSDAPHIRFEADWLIVQNFGAYELWRSKQDTDWTIAVDSLR